ncbi:hypothetical protein K461DRAFT_277376 [Myriangium duriaei CBS 260.36]|uniref:FHA domain-containing protein n=1 Tax=Myriangium duriaei CBS 260.36 TaxID=1168546 RepID=A0A9P4MP18_9PEZI|nr:hypothetical protein K461DRAFT_277376 [Myriangium duriaei CBS 260.36]
MDAQNIQSSPPRAPSLLPAFEPLSSSPGGMLPRLSKRKYDEHARDDRAYYPTPVPTSSTGMLPSSPRPGLHRTVSALSERAPLGAVPSLDVPSTGEPVLMGRSSNSSDYQLSANRLISRVHVRATYHAPADNRPDGEILVECLGWNGCKIHYRGQAVDLAKGESFISDKPMAQIMVDVQDTRVLLIWPRADAAAAVADLSRDSSPSPSRSPFQSPSKRRALDRDVLASSPPPMCMKIRSPKSLSPRNLVDTTFESTFIASQPSNDADAVQVYEDSDSIDEFPRDATPTPGGREAGHLDEKPAILAKTDSMDSGNLSDPEELSEHDEENDPVVYSFGPFGENLLDKFSSFNSTASPSTANDDARSASNPLRIKLIHSAGASPRYFRESPVKNHVVNQLAYSRVHSLPLSTIFSNVPSEMKRPKSSTEKPESTVRSQAPMTRMELKTLMSKIPCIGQINREGKDAAGQPLEDEFYYLPDLDEDVSRQAAVSIGRPPMRNVRKQHKQYFWKPPK